MNLVEKVLIAWPIVSAIAGILYSIAGLNYTDRYGISTWQE